MQLYGTESMLMQQLFVRWRTSAVCLAAFIDSDLRWRVFSPHPIYRVALAVLSSIAQIRGHTTGTLPPLPSPQKDGYSVNAGLFNVNSFSGASTSLWVLRSMPPKTPFGGNRNREGVHLVPHHKARIV